MKISMQFYYECVYYELKHVRHLTNKHFLEMCHCSRGHTYVLMTFAAEYMQAT